MGFDIYVRWEGFDGFDSPTGKDYARQSALSHCPAAGKLSYSVNHASTIRELARLADVKNPLGFLLEQGEDRIVVTSRELRRDGSKEGWEVRRKIRRGRDALLDALVSLRDNRHIDSADRGLLQITHSDILSFYNYVLLLALEGKQSVAIHVSY